MTWIGMIILVCFLNHLCWSKFSQKLYHLHLIVEHILREVIFGNSCQCEARLISSCHVLLQVSTTNLLHLISLVWWHLALHLVETVWVVFGRLVDEIILNDARALIKRTLILVCSLDYRRRRWRYLNLSQLDESFFIWVTFLTGSFRLIKTILGKNCHFGQIIFIFGASRSG